MQVVSGGRSVWTYLFTALQLWRSLSASQPCNTLPEPRLNIYSKSKDSVVLVCRSPVGHHGIMFVLYRLREMVDSQELQSSVNEVHFTVNVNEGNAEEDQLFCCLYKDQKGCYSAFSTYLKLEHQRDAARPPSTPSFPPPVLSVKPSSGVVKHGDMLSFSCSVPTPPSESQSQSGFKKNKPLSFFLLRTAEQTGVTSLIHQPQASQVSSPELQPGVFTVGPVRGVEEGKYTCLYQITNKRRLINSTVSNVVQVTISDMLPQPTLVLQQQTDVWHLLCTGSPAYPSAVFSLYLADNEHPVAVQHAKAIYHQVAFPVPVQDTPVASYQCQYSVLLGDNWSHSVHSSPLIVTRGTSFSSASDMSGVDLPLVLGSISAVVLFLCSVALLVMVAHRKVKAAAVKKKRRQDAQFWSQVHAKDHVVDLTLNRSSFASQEWASEDTATMGTPLWNSLSTFTTPIHTH